MRRRDFILAAAMLSPVVRRALAQQTAKRIAVVYPAATVAEIANEPTFVAFVEGLKRLGYDEGANLTIERFSGGGNRDRYPDVAREIVSRQPDLIFSVGTPLTKQFKAATSTIPIVALTGDPIRLGILSSIARPGGNITGVSVDGGIELWAKRLELLAEAVPKLVNVVFVSTHGAWENPGGRGLRDAAQKLGISLVQAPLGTALNEAEYRRIFNSIQRDQVDGIMISDEGENYIYRFLLVQLVEHIRLPAIYNYRDQVEAGGLMSYACDIKSAFRRNAGQVVEILRGAKPSDMPYLQEVRFELVINQKTARALGITVSPSFLARADEVIE
jgi:putative ABC transport system substrate-binding protein